jgi:hypothetical protein
MCCGQKRTELRNNQAQSTTRVPQTFSGDRRTRIVPTQPSALPSTPTPPPHEPANTKTLSVQPQALARLSAPQSSISVRYLENSPIRVRGLVSGMFYEFSGPRAIQQVDARDASSLLSTRFFRLA